MHKHLHVIKKFGVTHFKEKLAFFFVFLFYAHCFSEKNKGRKKKTWVTIIRPLTRNWRNRGM